MPSSKTHVYPLAMDPAHYEALKKICKEKGLSVKEGLRSAIKLFLVENMTLLLNFSNPQSSNP